MAEAIVINKDVKTNNAIVPEAAEMEVALESDECDSDEQEIYVY